MSLMSNLYKMGGALNTAHNGLFVTSHNTSNVETEGYTRQRIIQTDSNYSNIGYNASGKMQVGLGVDIETLEQIRDRFLDKSYREENSRAQFYVAKAECVTEIEDILGEINGESISAEMNTLWTSISALSTHAEGTETRVLFLSNAEAFAIKANNIQEQLEAYQYKLDSKIKDTVAKVNDLSSQILEYNKIIAKYEATGDNANDYRDQRNLLLDEISSYGHVQISESNSGQTTVLFEGETLVSGIYRREMSLQYINDATGQNFVRPIWGNTEGQILPYNAADVRPVYSVQKMQSITQESGNDNGYLKGLMVARGETSANSNTPDSEVEGFIIPKLQQELDKLVSNVVKMINKVVTTDTYDMYGKQATEPVFNMIDDTVSGYDANGDPIYNKGYVFGNIKINQTLVDNPMKLGLSRNPNDIADTGVIQEMLTNWKDAYGEFSPESKDVGYSQNFETYYSELVGRLGGIGSQSAGVIKSQEILINDAENKRQSLSGVSLDEEMTNMITYQYAYSAAAKVFSTVDSMIESVLGML